MKLVFTKATFTIALLGAVTMVAACSHTFFQFHISGAERDGIEQTKNLLAISAQDINALQGVVDLEGRRAVEILAAGLTIEQTSADRQVQGLMAALFMSIMAESDDPVVALDQGTAWMAARVGQRIATHGLNQMGLGILGSVVESLADDSGQRLSEMQSSLERGQINTCRGADVIVSYDADILGHVHVDMADSDARYQAWRNRIGALHLVRFTCAHHHALMLLSRDGGTSQLRVIGWQFVTPAQWIALEPRLRRALDLPL